MATWTHFFSESDQVNKQEASIFRSNSFAAPTTTAATAASAVVSPANIHPLAESVLLRSLSAEMSSSAAPAPANPAPVATNRAPNPIPRRNLMEAFEELHIQPPGTDVEGVTLQKSLSIKGEEESQPPAISPTGVTDLVQNAPKQGTTESKLLQPTAIITPDKTESISGLVPTFYLHPELKRELSDALVNRVSFYAVIHDINKEATAMAASDDSGYNRNPEDMHEEYDPLVVAVNGPPDENFVSNNSFMQVALIDEERWLLDTIEARSNEETRWLNACPPTFLQAMGERDYENPLASLSNGSRTQLWKPSRSWWEAKSGKNPWIEPKSHNKRWRYLWPLIHYHKFLARCIKKLKRNGVDVKTSVSPVSVFLREEVCAVSDHLASVSLFDSDEWMQCLEYFNGWVASDRESEVRLRDLVSSLSLRPLMEPGDIDSPLLRNQIDEQYLRAMASSRSQMAGAETKERQPRALKGIVSAKQRKGRDDSKIQNYDFSGPKYRQGDGHPPVYPRQGVSPNPRPPLHAAGMSPANALPRHLWGYQTQPNHWWGNNWGNGVFVGEDGGIHGGFAGDGIPQHFEMNQFGGPMQQQAYYPPFMYPQHPQAQVPFDPNLQDPASVYGFNGPDQWIQHPMNNPAAREVQMPGTPGHMNLTQEIHANSSHADANAQMNVEQTPFKYNAHQVPMSPYWGHLDHATLAMMGIATPQTATASPQTPARTVPSSPDDKTSLAEGGYTMNAQPLLLRQQYYGYNGYGAREGYGPPSPATQFMMSPQNNFAYNYGYGNSQQVGMPSQAEEFNDSSESATETVASKSPSRNASTASKSDESS
ncbi:unnamed protein product [Cylindrotheca closterium]|uniref:Uncharacterized protein n=1 Tax=Cylindrotheca closterium TaxID=2856 RepID=A0AAD2PW05_9STRA|nr:unnamed protein product [Cylindrotheca closterium]